jgi:lipid A 4'-phosphatase
MNRAGLVIALAIGVGVGVVFAVYPQLDIAISRLFFNEQYRVFPAQYSLVSRHLRDAFTYIIALLVAPAFVALVLKLILPRRRMPITARASLFLIATLALGPGLMANTIFKDHWHRPRPPEITEFYGPEKFMPWWDPRGACDRNCSFVAGEGAGGFWTLAPAALAPPAWRAAAYGAALLFGAAAGAQRLSGGAHFFSDVAFSGVFTFLIIWLVYGLIYRWPRTRLTDEQIERWFSRLRGRRADP